MWNFRRTVIHNCQPPHPHVLLDSLSTCFLLFLLNVSHISWKEKVFICTSCSENVIYIFLEHRAYFRKSLKPRVDPKSCCCGAGKRQVFMEKRCFGDSIYKCILWVLSSPLKTSTSSSVWFEGIYNMHAWTLHWCSAVRRIRPERRSVLTLFVF